MNFLRLIITYQYLLDNKESTIGLSNARNILFSFAGSLRPLPLSKYEELNCFSQDLVVRLINILDLIYNKGLSDKKLKLYLADQYYYSEEETFKSVLANTASYDKKLRFYAFYYFCRNHKKFLS